MNLAQAKSDEIDAREALEHNVGSVHEDEYKRAKTKAKRVKARLEGRTESHNVSMRIDNACKRMLEDLGKN